MSKNKETIKSLNQLLQGEYMALKSFNNFISRADEDNIKESLKDIQKQHRDNIETLASYIQDIGGQPDEHVGMKGKMGEIKLNLDLGSKANKDKIIKKAIEGETRGVNMAEKVLRGNLDDKSREVAGMILDRDRSSIKNLNKLM